MDISISLIETFKSKELWQWDKNRQIKIECEHNMQIEEVHFENVYTDSALIVIPQKAETGELIANIPDILLMHAVPIEIYISSGICTNCRKTFKVNQRKKPSDHVYTETEIL